ncbi:hypothetical protein MM213_12805 [Belliella sp. R4-6]|uniref:Alpha-L-rhamnosidase n=1 Tax=Belliella alkalica TaxID=1730871 RepID=A0ABS9VD64_9BACT|nr:alpha-L-rhamnosidase C-terminal domain-containing protein [Belliella alkalica]MCH7414371.1 hypothetical protein [Belliella alkalica]
MKKTVTQILLFFVLLQGAYSQQNWQAYWITHKDSISQTNSWYCFRKDFKLDNPPSSVLAKIAIDTKYWLWINGELVVFEGGLKRGPSPTGTYFDEVQIGKYLVEGSNTIAILGWYMGKDGFSHVDSGRFGLYFEADLSENLLISDGSWKYIAHPAYETCPPPLANYRLSESSIRFDARNDLGEWYQPAYAISSWSNAIELGEAPLEPWNDLHRRPIPQWKNSGIIAYKNQHEFPLLVKNDTTIICELPSNIQITPYLKVEADTEGEIIEMKTETFYGGGPPNIYAQYVIKKGVQEYESFGWMNGHNVIYKIPAGVKIIDLKYRETGYDTEFSGSFTSSNEFLNKIWQKSLRTLYLTMRDTYMDCPDRERAQWWGDVVNESGEAFFALDTASHLLQKKGMYELISWQKQDSTLFSPIPAGNWDKELPIQMLTSVGYYGFYNYYLNTGDLATISDLYPGVKKYLGVWKQDADGAVLLREGGWLWGDWGENKDLQLLTNGFYYLALKGALKMAEALGICDDVTLYETKMKLLKDNFNSRYWTGSGYRHPDYKGETDDRSQAVAVVSGIAEADKYPVLFEVFKREEHASPYMEKYVLEALFQMGMVDYALERMEKRFGPMVENPDYDTLFEGWNIGDPAYGGGTTNHAWSGGALTILSQYLCGISPLEPGYKNFQIVPNPGSVQLASAEATTVKGLVKSNFENKEHEFLLEVSIPKGTDAVVGIPFERDYTEIKLGNKTIWKSGKPRKSNKARFVEKNGSHLLFEVKPGNYRFTAIKI